MSCAFIFKSRFCLEFIQIEAIRAFVNRFRKHDSQMENMKLLGYLNITKIYDITF